jgi:hypothetical protein
MWVYRALAFVLILPWPEVTDAHQEWEQRSRDIEALMLGATAVFRNIHQNPTVLQNQQVMEQGMHVDTCLMPRPIVD